MVLNNRYSQHARRALSQARLIAQGFQHAVVDTDHLLVGVLRERGSLGAQVLQDLGIDVQRAELEVRVLHDVVDPLVTPLELTPALRRVLALSVEESNWFAHHYIGTEHLLLALARTGEGSAVALLRTLAIIPDQIRRRVRLLLHGGVTELNIEAAKRMARLSELSRRVLNAAGQMAATEQDQPAGIAHLLAVLARERRSVVSRLLHEAGLQQDDLLAAVQAGTASQADDPRAVLEDVIDHAVDRADQLGMHYTGTEHILLALAENPQGAALLQRFGVEAARLVAVIYRDLLPGEANG
jgi:ATP-dependent Clp protease ATP-binding subunit ClpA